MNKCIRCCYSLTFHGFPSLEGFVCLSVSLSLHRKMCSSNTVEESKNRRIEESKNRRIEESKNRRIEESKNRRIEGSKDRRIEESKDRRIEESKNRRIEESKDRWIEGSKDRRIDASKCNSSLLSALRRDSRISIASFHRSVNPWTMPFEGPTEKKYRSDVSTSSSPPQPPSTTALRKRPRPSFAPFSNNLLLLFSLLLLAFKRMHAVWKSMHAQACLLLVTSGVCGVVEWPKDNLWPRLRKVRGAQNGSGVSVRLRFCLFASLLMKQFAVRHRFYRSCVLVFVHSFIHSCRTTLLMNAGRMQLLRRRIWTKFFNTRAIRQAPGASAKEENFGRMNE